MKNAIAAGNGDNWREPTKRGAILPRLKPSLAAILGCILLLTPMAGTAQVQSLVASNTTFSLNLYRQLATNSGNLFFSPYSISACLAMLYAGASGNTEQQMSQVLGFATDQQQFASTFGDLQRELETNQEPNVIELNLANALWTQESFPFLPAFLATATNQYQANINQADFVTEAGAMTEEINDWVAQETQNKIQNILSPGMVNPDHRTGSGQRHYFLGVWTTSFEATNTSTQPFYLSSTKARWHAPLMHQPVPLVWFSNSITWRPAIFRRSSCPMAVTRFRWSSCSRGRLRAGGNRAGAFAGVAVERARPNDARQQVEVLLPRFTLESTFGV